MAYKKKNRGASLVVNQFDNQLNIVGNYFNKWVHHEINLDEKKTKIVTGTQTYQLYDKPVVWRDKWLQSRFINCKQKIKKCQFLGKVVSKFNSYLKQEKDNAIVLHPDAEGHNDKMHMVRPEVLVSCIESVKEEFPHMLKSRRELCEHAQNIFEVTQGREPELDDLPF